MHILTVTKNGQSSYAVCNSEMYGIFLLFDMASAPLLQTL